MSEKKIVVQVFDDRYSELAAITVPIINRWCNLNGWEHEVTRDQIPQSLDPDPNYRKYQIISRALGSPEKYQKVLYLDADVVARPGARQFQFDPNCDVAVSVDPWGWCAGVMAFRAGVGWSEQFVKSLLLLLPPKGRHHLDEQESLAKIISLPGMKDHIRRIPETDVANPCSPKSYDPIFIHLWGNGKNYAGAVATARGCAAAFDVAETGKTR